MWFKVDDQIPFHPKIIQVGNQALGLWARAGAWSGQQLTDGYVPDEMVKALQGTRADTTRLVQAGLWDKVTGGFQFHDWHKYQPHSRKVRKDQAEARERMRRLRENTEKKGEQ